MYTVHFTHYSPSKSMRRRAGKWWMVMVRSTPRWTFRHLYLQQLTEPCHLGEPPFSSCPLTSARSRFSYHYRELVYGFKTLVVAQCSPYPIVRRGTCEVGGFGDVKNARVKLCWFPHLYLSLPFFDMQSISFSWLSTCVCKLINQFFGYSCAGATRTVYLERTATEFHLRDAG